MYLNSVEFFFTRILVSTVIERAVIARILPKTGSKKRWSHIFANIVMPIEFSSMNVKISVQPFATTFPFSPIAPHNVL